jgi:hypothetical protein
VQLLLLVAAAALPQPHPENGNCRNEHGNWDDNYEPLELFDREHQ